jgi:site-specific DNA recombinase
VKTAVIYARYSSENQTEQSIEGQLRVCSEYAKSHDILILDTYIDRAMTGTNDNRADFQRMIKNSNRREWNFVLVYKLDRFSRNKYEMAMHKKTLKDNGAKVLSATEFIPDTPEGIIFESMLEGYAEYYSAELSQKVRRGMNESRLKGNFTGGRLPYGYRVENKKIKIDENRAEVVRYIFEQYACGLYVRNIIYDLTEKEIMYLGKPFEKNIVYNILKNEKYAGIYRVNGQVYENMFPRIVPNETYEKVRAKIQKNQYGKRSVKVTYLLRHKLKCGYCGQSINAECGTSQNGKKKYYYKCWGRKFKSGCKKAIIRKELLEDIVLENIIGALSSPQTMNEIVNGLMAEQERQAQKSSILNLLLKEKRQVEISLENLVNAIEQGIISNITNKRLHELEHRQEELERQILIERSKQAIMIPEKEIREYYQAALKLEPQLLIDMLVKEIVLYDDKIEIHFNSPIRNSPDDCQGFSFYHNVANISYTDPHRTGIFCVELEIEIRV